MLVLARRLNRSANASAVKLALKWLRPHFLHEIDVRHFQTWHKFYPAKLALVVEIQVTTVFKVNHHAGAAIWQLTD